MNHTPLLEVRDLKKYFPLKKGRGTVRAVDGVSFSVEKGETFGIVGESGCGKSTLGRLTLRLLEPDRGQIFLDRVPVHDLGAGALRKQRRQMQMVFQDAMASLDSRQKIGHIIAEPLKVHGLGSSQEREETVVQLLEKVGLDPEARHRYPHEFSGGQRQRICIARAISLNPALVVADEPVSALDVSIQSQVLNLLVDLRKEMGLSYLFISHDLAVVEHICNRIAVMYLGTIVETAHTRDLFARPAHPYTQTLLSAIPRPDPRNRNKERILLKGDIPGPADIPRGCRFHTRCPHAAEICREKAPKSVERRTDRGVHTTCCHRGFETF